MAYQAEDKTGSVSVGISATAGTTAAATTLITTATSGRSGAAQGHADDGSSSDLLDVASLPAHPLIKSEAFVNSFAGPNVPQDLAAAIERMHYFVSRVYLIVAGWTYLILTSLFVIVFAVLGMVRAIFAVLFYLFQMVMDATYIQMINILYLMYKPGLVLVQLWLIPIKMVLDILLPFVPIGNLAIRRRPYEINITKNV